MSYLVGKENIMVSLATINVSKLGNYRITYYAKGNISIDIVHGSLKSAYINFFVRAKQYGLTEMNTAFTFIWEK